MSATPATSFQISQSTKSLLRVKLNSKQYLPTPWNIWIDLLLLLHKVSQERCQVVQVQITGMNHRQGFYVQVALAIFQKGSDKFQTWPLTLRDRGAQRWCAVRPLSAHSCWDWGEGKREGARVGKQGGASNPVVQIPSIKKKKHDCIKQPPTGINHFKHANTFFFFFNLSCACLCTQFSLLVITERHQNIGFVQSVFQLTPDTSLPVDITLLLKIEL